LSYSAIGYSTNLIAADSNLIVVRGVEDPKAAYNQMIKAVEQFFPDDGILELDEVNPQVQESTVEKPPLSPKPGNLRRAPTGLSDILDNDNGQKPGGFILVIDGAALTHVS
jgi:phospholipid-translocating ATPase